MRPPRLRHHDQGETSATAAKPGPPKFREIGTEMCGKREIKVAVEQHFGVITFVVVPEADEFRQTHALLSDQTSVNVVECSPAD